MNNSSKMDVFIQALYGVVMGVSLGNFKNSPLEIFDAGLSDIRFNFLFLVFTFIIVAHDWYSYHKNTLAGNDGFWYFISQIGSLLCVGFMFNSAQIERVESWYAFGGIYTLLNIVNTCFFSKKNARLQKRFYIAYVFHAAICITVVFFLPAPDPAKNMPLYSGVFAGTVAIVIFFWLFIDLVRDQTTIVIINKGNLTIKPRWEMGKLVRLSIKGLDLSSKNQEIEAFQKLEKAQTDAEIAAIENGRTLRDKEALKMAALKNIFDWQWQMSAPESGLAR